jgi:hypothetical protein
MTDILATTSTSRGEESDLVQYLLSLTFGPQPSTSKPSRLKKAIDRLWLQAGQVKRMNVITPGFFIGANTCFPLKTLAHILWHKKGAHWPTQRT